MQFPPEVLERNPHLAAYLAAWTVRGGPPPAFLPVLTRDLRNQRPYNFVYPVGDPVFVHVVDEPGSLFPRYHAVEPQLSAQDGDAYEALRGEVFLRSPEVRVPETPGEYEAALSALLDRVLKGNRLARGTGLRRRALTVSPDLVHRLRYMLMRDIVGNGQIEPLIRDPWIEDVNAIGTRDIHVVHKIFGMVHTDIRFPDVSALDAFLEVMGERIGRPVSATYPIVDGALPSGSRINVLYSDDISKGGSSFTIRKQSETPLSIGQLVEWNTMSARLAAYLWLCVEQGMSLFICGETASGKTTTLNSILPFVRPRSKVLTAEDTPEVLPPHSNWQQLITRDRGIKDHQVTMHDLLRSALRSRPNYIIVGEIRGAEGAVAFQAMQSGHPTIATFHASSISKLFQRLSSPPINVPLPFLSNLNLVLIQSAVYIGGKMLRRVVAVEEIEGYDKRTNTVVTRQVFAWDPVHDRHQFSGRNNSFVLENIIAERMRLKDRREAYRELDRRTQIMEEIVRRRLVESDQSARFFFDYHERGAEALPFALPAPGVGAR